MSRRKSLVSLREWLACMAHAALVEVTERLAPSADLLPDTEDVFVDAQVVRADMRETLFGQIAARLAAADLTDERIEAQIAAWKAAS